MRRVLAFLAAWGFLIPGTPEAATWVTETEVLPPMGSRTTLGQSGRPAVVDGSGRVHLVLQSDADTTFQVGYTLREAGGTWSLPLLLSDPDEDARNPTLALGNDGRIHLVWQRIEGTEGDLVYRIRDPQGSWSDAVLLAPAPSISEQPAIAVDSFGRVHLVWIDARSGSRDILYMIHRADEGWSEPVSLNPGGRQPQNPNLVTDGLGNAFVVWVERGTFPALGSDILYRRIESSGLSATTTVKLVDHLGAAERPYILAEPGGTLHVVWEDDRNKPGIFEIYYKRQFAGLGWTRDKRFTYDQEIHERPALARGSRGSINVVWEDYRTGNPEIYYRQITVATGWDRDLSRMTVDASASQAPALVGLPDGKLLLIWQDAQGEGTPRIFSRIGDEDVTP